MRAYTLWMDSFLRTNWYAQPDCALSSALKKNVIHKYGADGQFYMF